MRPLDGFRSIKMKLGSVIVFAVGMTIVVMYALIRFALKEPGSQWWQVLVAGTVAAAIALVLARLLASGMTKPLRDMAGASARMARGDYSHRVETNARDEVGQLASAFNRMAGEVESVERMRRELVANVSHELKTPISALQAHLENLLDGVEEMNPEVLAVMLQQSQRLARLVDQLLDISRLESGELPLHVERVTLGPLADEVIAEVAIARGELDVHLANEIPSDFPSVPGDRERLHQVLYNLLDNAVRFSPRGGRVTVLGASVNGHCQISVTDGGPGIPFAERSKVFERFYRIDPARSRSDGGTGLGLAIARSVIEAHDGTIWVEDKDPGATFSFRVPR